MGKISSALIGAAVGALIAYTITYLFGPADETTFDHHYQSRLDFARSEGLRAAQEHEAELRKKLADAQGKLL